MDKAIVLVLLLFDSVLMLNNISFGAKSEEENKKLEYEGIWNVLDL